MEAAGHSNLQLESSLTHNVKNQKTGIAVTQQETN